MKIVDRSNSFPEKTSFEDNNNFQFTWQIATGEESRLNYLKFLGQIEDSDNGNIATPNRKQLVENIRQLIKNLNENQRTNT
jgi:hypothetical protein